MSETPMLNRALGEERVPIFFSEKTIPPDEHSLGGAEFEVDFKSKSKHETGGPIIDPEKVDRAVLPGIIRNHGQPVPGSWYLIDKEALKEMKRLMDNCHKEENFQDADYYDLLERLEKMVNKALEL